MREQTRHERYIQKSQAAKIFPLAVGTMNFEIDGNLGFVIRAAACFGAYEVLVLGSLPKPSVLKALSGGMSDHIEIKTFSNPRAFLEYSESQDYELVTLELSDRAKPLQEEKFSTWKRTLIVSGHETTGIPVEISKYSRQRYIPMPGIGYCLNTSQAINIALYEYTRQMNS